MAPDWAGIDLVVFDVDGTLYRQRPLRLRMARELLVHSVRRRDAKIIAVLARYRRLREQLGEAQAVDFEPALVARTAAAASVSPDKVRAIVAEWIDERPLRHLAACRYPGLPQLFAGLRRRGKAIGVLSDYSARAKLEALDLAADHVAGAADAGIGVLKPHPRGLNALIAMAGAAPHRTLVIGDRPDRDGLAAHAAGAKALIRSSRPIAGWQTFARYDDPLFAPVL